MDASYATEKTESQLQHSQRGVFKTIMLVFSVTLATIVNVRLISNSTVIDFHYLAYLTAGCECFSFRNSFTYHRKGNAPSTNRFTTSMDCFRISSQLCKPPLSSLILF